MAVLWSLRGIVPLTLGLLIFAYGAGMLPAGKGSEEAAAQRAAWGPLLRTLGSIVGVLGILQLLGYF